MMRRLLITVLIAAACPAQAQVPPPPPLPSLPDPASTRPPATDRVDEPSVTIPTQEGDIVEEVRDGGRVIMLKVTPKDGPTYYLQDPNGTGHWMRRDGLDGSTHGPMWPVFTF